MLDSKRLLTELINIAGPKVTVSLYFAVFIACLLVLDHTGLAVFALLCVVVHEAGHITAAALTGAGINAVQFRLFGISIRMKGNVSLSYGQELAVSLAGCAANALLCFAAFIAVKTGFFVFQMQMIFLFSLMIALFNLLPVASLDGGRALYLLIENRSDGERADKLLRLCSFCFILPLATAGFYLLR